MNCIHSPVVRASGDVQIWKTLLSTCICLAFLGTTWGDGVDRDEAFVGYSEQSTSDAGGDVLKFQTDAGAIKVTLRPDAAPKTVRQLKEWVNMGLYDGCDIYRSEPPGPTQDDGKPGVRDGYALVQGGMYTCGRQKEQNLPVESTLLLLKWNLAVITGTSEFFFCMDAHPEWEGSFTVVGQVDDISSRQTLESILKLPTRQEPHPSGTVLRVLVNPVKFQKVSLVNV